MMAVEFSNEGYTIHIHTGCNPIDDWLNLFDQLLELLAAVDKSSGRTPNDFYTVFNLLQDMMPDYTTAKKMTD